MKKNVFFILITAMSISSFAFAGGDGGNPQAHKKSVAEMAAGDGGGPKMVRGGGIGFSSVRPEGAGTNSKAKGAEGNYRLKGAEGNGPMGHGSNG